MGASSSSVASERRSIPFYLKHSPLSVAMSEGSIDQFATCFELVELAANSDLEASRKIPGRSGDFFVIGEGQVDVSVKVPTINKKTGYIREVLCSKKQGDILYVPAVERSAATGSVQTAFAHRKSNLSENEGCDGETADDGGALATTSRLHRSSARLFNLLLRNDKRLSRGSAVTEKAPCVASTDLAASSNQTSETIGAHSPKNKPAVVIRADQSVSRIEKLMKHLDMTTVSAPYGAVLLRLDKHRFDAFEASARRIRKESSNADSSLPTRSQQSPPNASLGNVVQSPPMTRTVPEPDFELMRVMMASNIQDYLKRIPFLTKVPSSRLQMLGEMSQFEVLPADSVVCSEGTEVSYRVNLLCCAT